MILIRCMGCGDSWPKEYNWWTCDTCGYRLCLRCLTHHHGGIKCDKCLPGYLKSAR